MIPDQTKRVQAERRIQSAANRSTFRANKPKQPARKKQNADSKDFELLKVKINALTTLFKVFPNLKIKEDLHCILATVCFTDSSYANPTRSQTKSQKQPLLRKANKNQYTHNLRTNNDKYIKNLSTKILTDQETALLAKGLKFIPTPPKPASHKNLLKDFEAFTRSMRFQY